MRYYVDDGILVELQWWPDGRRCLRAVQSLASDHFRLLGERGVSDPPLLSTSKITDWDTRLEVLGWIIDTEALTVTLPSRKRLKLRSLLAEWPPSRASASARQVSKLAGFLMHISFAVRPGLFFVQRLLASVGMPRVASGAGFAYRMPDPGRRVALGPEFHGDLEFWRWFAAEGLDTRGGTLSAVYRLLERPARRTLFSDASKTAVGGFVSRRGFSGVMSSTTGSGPGFAVGAGWLVARMTYQSTCSSCWAWSFRRGFLWFCVLNDRRRGVTAFCCGGTTKPPCSGCGAVAVGLNRGPVP